MNKNHKLYLAAMLLTLTASTADARKPSRGGSGATATNYGCMTLAAGKVLGSPDGTTQKTLLMSTYACYVCNTTTRVCTLQSPSTLYGWTFVY